MVKVSSVMRENTGVRHGCEACEQLERLVQRMVGGACLRVYCSFAKTCLSRRLERGVLMVYCSFVTTCFWLWPGSSYVLARCTQFL